MTSLLFLWLCTDGDTWEEDFYMLPFTMQHPARGNPLPKCCFNIYMHTRNQLIQKVGLAGHDDTQLYQLMVDSLTPTSDVLARALEAVAD